MIVVDQNGVQCAVATEATAAGNGSAQVLVRWQSGEQALLPKELLQRQADGRYQLAYSMQRLLAEYSSIVPANSQRADSQVTSSSGVGDYGVSNAATEQELVVPIVEEQVVVETRTVETGRIQIQKTIQERVEVIDQPLFEEEVQIERVAINRPITEAVTPHYEGDTLIIPLVEEVLVVQKQLVLREEVHIKKVRKELHEPQEVRLRTEAVNVVRAPEAGPASGQEAAKKSS
jgi:uncharacterized protein (TIGR02271 family)